MRLGIVSRPGKSYTSIIMPRLRTEEYFRERSSRADIGKAKRILRRAGRGRPPVPGDELVPSSTKQKAPSNRKVTSET